MQKRFQGGRRPDDTFSHPSTIVSPSPGPSGRVPL